MKAYQWTYLCLALAPVFFLLMLVTSAPLGPDDPPGAINGAVANGLGLAFGIAIIGSLVACTVEWYRHGGDRWPPGGGGD